MNVSDVVLTDTRWTVVLPPALPWSVATTAELELTSMPGVTDTRLEPAATVAIPALFSNRTRPTVRSAMPDLALLVEPYSAEPVVA